MLGSNPTHSNFTLTLCSMCELVDLCTRNRAVPRRAGRSKLEAVGTCWHLFLAIASSSGSSAQPAATVPLSLAILPIQSLLHTSRYLTIITTTTTTTKIRILHYNFIVIGDTPQSRKNSIIGREKYVPDSLWACKAKYYYYRFRNTPIIGKVTIQW